MLFPSISHGAVLSHVAPTPLWAPDHAPDSWTVSLSRNNELIYTHENIDTLPQQPAGGPYSLRITLVTESSIIEVDDLYYGEVFLLTGQSNMQLTVARCLDPMPDRFMTMVNPLIRELRLDVSPSFDVDNVKWPSHLPWRSLSPDSLLSFGALGLAFAEARFRETGIPIGLINCAAGGTPIEAWLPHEDLADAPEFLDAFNEYRSVDVRASIDQAYQVTSKMWHQDARSQDQDILGLPFTEREMLPWITPEFPKLFFNTVYEDQPGIYWLRCVFQLTEEEHRFFEGEATHKRLRLDLGALVDADESYLNGQKIGRTDYMYPPRRYPLPPNLLRSGMNEILIRLTVHRHTGGAISGKHYGLTTPAHKLDLTESSEWQVLQTARMEPLPHPIFWDRLAGTCFYSYIQPVQGLPVSGILWYQGESNDRNPTDYADRFRRLIERYQSLFPGQPPFVYVQLTQFDDQTRQVPEGSWDILRQAQEDALQLPNTAQVCSLDLGEANDLHPQQKWVLGKRMAESFRELT